MLHTHRCVHVRAWTRARACTFTRRHTDGGDDRRAAHTRIRTHRGDQRRRSRVFHLEAFQPATITLLAALNTRAHGMPRSNDTAEPFVRQRVDGGAPSSSSTRSAAARTPRVSARLDEFRGATRRGPVLARGEVRTRVLSEKPRPAERSTVKGGERGAKGEKGEWTGRGERSDEGSNEGNADGGAEEKRRSRACTHSSAERDACRRALACTHARLHAH